MQDPALKGQLLESAAEKLTSCLGFTRGDVAPANALGDVLCDAAELLLQQQQHAAAGGGAGGGVVGAGGVGPGVDVAAVAALYRRAAEEGYQAALTIRRAEPDALVREAGGVGVGVMGQPAVCCGGGAVCALHPSLLNMLHAASLKCRGCCSRGNLAPAVMHHSPFPHAQL
jgi:hypothetical protein